MNLQELGEQLRKTLQQKIAAGGTTQSEIAERTGFRQAHISNFLNGRRALSFEGLDRLLRSQKLQIEDLLPVTIEAGSLASPYHDVPIVSPRQLASTPKLTAERSIAISRQPSISAPPSRRHWDRFAALQLSSSLAEAMPLTCRHNDTAVLDRHRVAHNTSETQGIFAVAIKSKLALRYIERHGNRIVLRPEDTRVPVTITTPHNKSIQVLGRLCFIARPV